MCGHFSTTRLIVKLMIGLIVQDLTLTLLRGAAVLEAGCAGPDHGFFTVDKAGHWK
jgi:hypothetical protein